MTEEELFESMTDWVNSDENKIRRIYAYGLVEKIVKEYSDKILPCYSAPVGGYTIKNGKLELKEGYKGSRTNNSNLKIENPDYQTTALTEACRNNPYTMDVKGLIGLPIAASSLIDNESGEILETTLSINNTLFNGLCREAKIPFKLEEVDDSEMAW